MKVAVVLLATLVVAYGAPQKRFFLTDIQNAFNTLAHQLNEVIHNAKEQFNQLASGYNVNFNNVVDLLVDQIDSMLMSRVSVNFNNVVDLLVDQIDSMLMSRVSVNFNNVVDLLVDQIDSGMTEAGCSNVCVGGAATILGPAAPIASLVCGPACNAALAKIEEAAG
ncbi:hypothetical protein ACOMHN_035022 [Nucella lapillus]